MNQLNQGYIVSYPLCNNIDSQIRMIVIFHIDDYRVVYYDY